MNDEEPGFLEKEYNEIIKSGKTIKEAIHESWDSSELEDKINSEFESLKQEVDALPYDQVTGLYLSRAFCKATKCRNQALIEDGKLDKSFCKLSCVKTAHEFHHWLQANGFEIKKKKFKI